MSGEYQVSKMVQFVAEQSIDKSSQVLSKMLKSGARIDLKKIEFVDISLATEKANQQNNEVIGAFIDLVGDAPFKFLFFIKTEDAFVITDLFIGQEVGTTKTCDEYTISAVQEVGNILASAISNVFCANFQITMKPTPPTIVRDFSGTIFQEFLIEAATDQDVILLIESMFQVVRSELDCHMYLLPIAGSEKVLGFSTGV